MKFNELLEKISFPASFNRDFTTKCYLDNQVRPVFTLEGLKIFVICVPHLTSGVSF